MCVCNDGSATSSFGSHHMLKNEAPAVSAILVLSSRKNLFALFIGPGKKTVRGFRVHTTEGLRLTKQKRRPPFQSKIRNTHIHTLVVFRSRSAVLSSLLSYAP